MSDDFDRPVSSPPNSPGLLPRIREKDDDFAVASDSDAWSLSSDRSDRTRSGSSNYDTSSSRKGSFRRRSSARSSAGTEDGRDNVREVGKRSTDDSNVELLTISSDSYFSHHRDMLEDKTASVQNSPIRSSPLSRRIHDYETDSPIRGTPPPEGGVRHRRRSSEKSTPRARGSSRSRTRAKEEVEISPTAQIYKNLLILEEALRQQNAQQSKLKAKYTIFLVSMLFVLLLTFYVSFVDGGGEGGGPSYWRFSCQVVGSIDFLTLVLYYLSGEYNRTITRPRKFLTYTNKGIRRMNIRLVKVRVKRVDRLLDMVKMCLLFPTIVLKTQCQYVLVVFPRFGLVIKLRNWLLEFEAKLQSSSGGGVDGVKVILNPRVFSTGTREQWELYRNEFWNKETIRRRRAIQRKQE